MNMKTKLKIWCIFLFGILAFSLTGYANADSWIDNFDGTELSSHWQLALKGATSGDIFANVADGYVETGLSGGYDWWDSGGIATSNPISPHNTIRITINKTGQAMSCYNYFHGGYIPCGFEFYLYNHPWAHWSYRAYLTEPPSEHYGFGIYATDGQGLAIAKVYAPDPTHYPNIEILYLIPSEYWAADGIWEILKDGSNFSLWYNGAIIGDVYNIPEIADKDLYFVADARRYAGWETVYVKLDSVEVYEPQEANISVSPESHDFEDVEVGSTSEPQEFTISNTGTEEDLVISSIGMVGGDADMFNVEVGGANPCLSLTPTILPGEGCTIAATFSPTSIGEKSTDMRISSNDPDTPELNVALSGTGVFARFEEDDPAIIYSGTWDTYICVNCSGRALKYSDETGAKAEFSFTGTGIRWIVTKADTLGMANVYLDGVYIGKVNLYSQEVRHQVVLQKKGLFPGNHSITIEVSGMKYPHSIGYYIDIDAFEVVP